MKVEGVACYAAAANTWTAVIRALILRFYNDKFYTEQTYNFNLNQYFLDVYIGAVMNPP